MSKEKIKIGDIEYPVTDVELPSRAVIYDNDLVPPIVKIRPMTTKEEKILYGSNSANALDIVIKNCVVEPKTLNLSHLIVPDKYAILVALRIISIGDLYPVKHKCEHCGEVNDIDIMLSELKVNYLGDDFQEPYEIKLESINSVVGIKLLRGRDLDAVDEMVKKIKRKSKQAFVGDMGYTFRLAKYIQEIDGKAVTFDKALKFVESWTMRTSLEFRDAIENIEVGHDLDIVRECMYCGMDMEFSLPFTAEFFRPTRR